MNNIIGFSTVSVATVLSVGLGVLIEVALLKIVFCCLAKVKVAGLNTGEASR